MFFVGENMNKIIITLTLIILSFSIYGCGETETTITTGGNTPNIPTPPEYVPTEEKLIFDKDDIYNIPIALENIEAENIDDASIVIHITNYTANDYKNITFTPTITTADGAELTNMGTIKAYLYRNVVDLPKNSTISLIVELPYHGEVKENVDLSIKIKADGLEEEAVNAKLNFYSTIQPFTVENDKLVPVTDNIDIATNSSMNIVFLQTDVGCKQFYGNNSISGSCGSSTYGASLEYSDTLFGIEKGTNNITVNNVNIPACNFSSRGTDIGKQTIVLHTNGAENHYLSFAPFYCYVNVSAKQAADEGNTADITYNMYNPTSGTFTLPGLKPTTPMKFNIIDSTSTSQQ